MLCANLYRQLAVPLSVLRPRIHCCIAINHRGESLSRLLSTAQRLPRNDTASAVLAAGEHAPTLARGNNWLNTADHIDRQLREDGHRVWGLAIYRCTYDDDAAWQLFLRRLNAAIRSAMQFYDGLDLLQEGRFRLNVFDDARAFDGAHVHKVRQHFHEWRKHAVREEQGTPEEIEARREKPESPPPHPHGTVELDEELWERLKGEPQEADKQARKDPTPEILRPGSGHGYGYRMAAVRYRFCVHVDRAALQSIVAFEGEVREGRAWVNLIEGDWYPELAAAQREQGKSDIVAMGLDEEDFDDELGDFPEIDGCVEENVGWMRVAYQDLIPGFYADMADHNTYEETYVRPPCVRTG